MLGKATIWISFGRAGVSAAPVPVNESARSDLTDLRSPSLGLTA